MIARRNVIKGVRPTKAYLADLCVLKGRKLDYQVFVDYYCRQEPEQTTWQELAARHCLAEWKQASRKADWVKRQLALAIRAEIARYIETEEEIDEELRCLLK